MISISDNEIPNWNPVPLRLHGPQNWESQKLDNFGQILAVPNARPGYMTIPGIYYLGSSFANMTVGSGANDLHVFVTDLQLNHNYNITSSCSVFTVGGKKYLKIPAVPLQDVHSWLSNVVFLTFVNVDKASNSRYKDWELVSEPYMIHQSHTDSQSSLDPWYDGPENQNPVVLRWGDGRDYTIEKTDGTVLIPYQTANFNFEVMFPCQLSKPQYKKTEEGAERDGLFFPEKIILTKEFHFFFNAPEYFLDALRFAQIADFVEVGQGEAKYAVDKIDFGITWEKEGNIAKVDCSFTTGTVVRKTANYYIDG